MNKDEIKLFQLRKGFIKDYIPNQIKAVQTRGRKVASTAITTDSTATVVNKCSASSSITKAGKIYYLTSLHPQENQFGSEQSKTKKSIKAGRLCWR